MRNLFTPVMVTILKREFRSYFATPLGYVFLVTFVFSIGYTTFEPGRGSFFLLRQADLTALFRYIPWLFVILVPAVSMRLWAEERRVGTIELLLTMPVSIPEAVWGKLLAAWLFILLSLSLTFPIVLITFYLGDPDILVMMMGYLASLLLGGTFLAISSFFSALTKSQVVSFILSVGGCYTLLMASSPPILEFLSSFLPRYCVDLFESLSILNHFEILQRGVLRLGDLWFYLVMIGGWSYATILIVQERKAN